jgi:tryptophan synthase beta chain
VILFGLSGHGHFDSQAYDDYLAGDHSDPEPTDEEIAAAMAELPEAPALA